MFWTNNKILSYNKPFNFVIGQRAGGKTFDSKNLAIRTFKTTGQLSIFVRREKTEFNKKFKELFFSDILHLWEGCNFEIKNADTGATAYLNDEPFIHFIALSTYYKHKSIPFNNVKWIIYDEFIINTNAGQRYLKGEGFSFMELYHTVARPYERKINGIKKLIDPKTRCLFLGNSISIVNPLFNYFKIKPLKNKEFSVFDNAVIQIWKGKKHREAMKKYSLNKSIDNMDYANYANDNEFYLDNDKFIEKKSNDSRYMCGFIVEGQFIGIWLSYKNSLIYINEQVDKNNLLIAIETQDQQPNILMIQYFKNTQYYRQIKLANENGLVRFSNHNVRYLFLTAMGYL